MDEHGKRETGPGGGRDKVTKGKKYALLAVTESWARVIVRTESESGRYIGDIFRRTYSHDHVFFSQLVSMIKLNS